MIEHLEPTVVAELPQYLAMDLDGGFPFLVREYQGLLMAMAFQSTRSQADAEDLVATCLLNAYRSMRGYGPQRMAQLKLRSWLTTILVNLIRNRWRKGLTDTLKASRPLREADEGVRNPSEERVLEGDQASVADLLGVLPPNQRIAVIMRHVIGYEMRDISEALGCPIGTARSHVSRGLARLRAELERGVSWQE